MSDKLKTLQTKRQKLAADIRAHADAANARAQTAGSQPGREVWSAEDTENWTRLNKDYDANLAELTAERQAVEAADNHRKAVVDRLAGVDGYRDYTPAVHPQAGRDGGSLTDGPYNRHVFGRQPDQVKNQFLAFHGWLLNLTGAGEHITDEQVEAARSLRVDLRGESFKMRLGGTQGFNRVQAAYRGGVTLGTNGEPINSRFVQNAVQEGKGSGGGFLVGETLLNRLEEAVLDYSGVLQVAEVLRTDTGETLRWPTVDDTANQGARVGESQDAGFGTSTDPKFGRLNLQAFVYHSNFINISRAFLTDAGIDLESKLGEMMGTRLGRKRNVDYTTGADVGNGPIGIVTAATGVAGTPNKLQAVSATALFFDDLVDVVHKIDPARRRMRGVGYMFHDKVLQTIRKFKDGVGRPLWVSGAAAGLPDTINDYSYWINQAMDSTIASGKNSVLFGQLSMYKVRQVNEIEIMKLVERRAEFYEYAFIAYMRSDGGLLDPGDHPVAYIQH